MYQIANVTPGRRLEIQLGIPRILSSLFFNAALFVTNKELRHDSARGGVAILTDKTNPVTSTSLLLRHVRLSDSGKYSCTPSNADPASVTLHVLQGLFSRNTYNIKIICYCQSKTSSLFIKNDVAFLWWWWKSLRVFPRLSPPDRYV